MSKLWEVVQVQGHRDRDIGLRFTHRADIHTFTREEARQLANDLLDAWSGLNLIDRAETRYIDRYVFKPGPVEIIPVPICRGCDTELTEIEATELGLCVGCDALMFALRSHQSTRAATARQAEAQSEPRSQASSDGKAD